MIRLKNVSKSFGSLKVTDDISLKLEQGEALGILGPNGAGKSTMFNLITGNVLPDAGQVYYGDQDITTAPPYDRCRLGIGRTYQIPHPFAKMTVFENLLVGAVFGSEDTERKCYDLCAWVLEETGLIKRANTLAGSLTLLERKRLELARAMATKPKVLLLDEIAGGLTERECDALVSTVQSIHEQGVSIIWIEHVVNALLSVVSRLYVIDFGKQIAEGDPQEVMGSPIVKEIYMGISA